jgi:excisionase family DNA binding protein
MDYNLTMDEKLMSITEVAKEKNKSRQAIHQWIKRNRIELVRIGNQYAIREVDVKRIPLK